MAGRERLTTVAARQLFYTTRQRQGTSGGAVPGERVGLASQLALSGAERPRRGVPRE